MDSHLTLVSLASDGFAKLISSLGDGWRDSPEIGSDSLQHGPWNAIQVISHPFPVFRSIGCKT